MDRSKCTMFGMDGRRIFMIVGNSHGALDELIMLDMQIPEEAFLSESVLVRIMYGTCTVLVARLRCVVESRRITHRGCHALVPRRVYACRREIITFMEWG